VALVARVADSPGQQVCTEAEVFTSLGRTVWTILLAGPATRDIAHYAGSAAHSAVAASRTRLG
jgi:hypothetical protein